MQREPNSCHSVMIQVNLARTMSKSPSRTAASATVICISSPTIGASASSPSFPVTRSSAACPPSAQKSKLSKSGQRVGLGWQSNSCGHCEWCLKGQENLCPESEATCVHRNGGYADRVRANNRFVVPIPDALESEHAAPLLCAGITVYNSLRTQRDQPLLPRRRSRHWRSRPSRHPVRPRLRR